jgi:hypothetical protein
MTNPWFRFYSEFSHDPKVQMMTEAMQRRYIMVMCLRCSNELVTLHETEIAFHLRITDAELDETKALFISKGFIDDKWTLLNWDKRQFKSDSSAERVSRHRANKKQASNDDVTLQQRQSNALEQIQNRTDTEQKQKPKAPAAPLPDWLQPEAWEDFIQHRKSLKSAMTPRAQTLLISELTKLRTQGHDPTEVLKQSIMRGWKGLFALNTQQTKGQTRHEYLADKIADLTGRNRHHASNTEFIHGTAERVD